MSTDRTEQFRRGGQSSSKTTTKHPYAAIEHRVIDSPAFADLKPTAQVLLLLVARQLTKDNNGHLQASFKWCKRGGSANPDIELSEISASMGDGNRLPRSRSNEKTPP